MKQKNSGIIIAFIAIILFNVQFVNAHCDHVEGPVIKAANKAIAESNVNYTLVWVQIEDNAKVIELFNEALPKIKSGDKNAEQKFYEDLVKIHRAGEGADYTGIKPADADMEPIIVAADAAVETGNLAVLHPYVYQDQNRHAQVVSKFQNLMALKDYDVNNLSAGREYVDEYVDFMKFVEGEEENAISGDIVAETKGSGGKKLIWIIAIVLGLATIGIVTSKIIRINKK